MSGLCCERRAGFDSHTQTVVVFVAGCATDTWIAVIEKKEKEKEKEWWSR